MVRVDINTGFNCNNNCRFCLQAGNKYKDNRSFEVIKADLESSRKCCDSAVFTGGEVTVRKDFFDLIRLAKHLGYKVIQVQSNGRMFASIDFCRKTIESGATEFSLALHGYCKEQHDFFTRVDSSFNQTIKGIINLRKLSVELTVRVYSNKYISEDLNSIIRLLHEIKVNNIEFVLQDLKENDILDSMKLAEDMGFSIFISGQRVYLDDIDQPNIVGNGFYPYNMDKDLMVAIKEGYEVIFSETYKYLGHSCNNIKLGIFRGKKFIIKISERSERLILRERKFLDLFQKKYKIPNLIRNLEGKDYTEFNGKRIRMYEFIDGRKSALAENPNYVKSFFSFCLDNRKAINEIVYEGSGQDLDNRSMYFPLDLIGTDKYILDTEHIGDYMYNDQIVLAKHLARVISESFFNPKYKTLCKEEVVDILSLFRKSYPTILDNNLIYEELLNIAQSMNSSHIKCQDLRNYYDFLKN